MIRAEREPAPKRIDPRLEALMGHRVDEVDADVGDAHRAGQVESPRGLRGICLPLEHRQSARLEALHAKTQAIDTALQPRRQP